MAFYLAYLLAFYLTFYLAYLLAFYLAVEVQRCTLSSDVGEELGEELARQQWTWKWRQRWWRRCWRRRSRRRIASRGGGGEQLWQNLTTSPGRWGTSGGSAWTVDLVYFCVYVKTSLFPNQPKHWSLRPLDGSVSLSPAGRSKQPWCTPLVTKENMCRRVRSTCHRRGPIGRRSTSRRWFRQLLGTWCARGQFGCRHEKVPCQI